jgi:hypothetical protein
MIINARFNRVRGNWLLTQEGVEIGEFSHFVVTGTSVKGKRFRQETNSFMRAFQINLWKGSVWGVPVTGKRVLLKRVSN